MSTIRIRTTSSLKTLLITKSELIFVIEVFNYKGNNEYQILTIFIQLQSGNPVAFKL
jgi:hypothetical protein